MEGALFHVSCAGERRKAMLSLRLPNSTWFALAIAVVMFPAHDCLAAAGQPVYYGVPRGAHPHDVAAVPAPGGPVFYTAQSTGKVGVLDPASGKTEEIPL